MATQIIDQGLQSGFLVTQGYQPALATVPCLVLVSPGACDELVVVVSGACTELTTVSAAACQTLTAVGAASCTELVPVAAGSAVCLGTA